VLNKKSDICIYKRCLIFNLVKTEYYGKQLRKLPYEGKV